MPRRRRVAARAFARPALLAAVLAASHGAAGAPYGGAVPSQLSLHLGDTAQQPAHGHGHPPRSIDCRYTVRALRGVSPASRAGSPLRCSRL
jgi:hypothetical protein